jgi:uncharacterized protein (DUF849 family)
VTGLLLSVALPAADGDVLVRLASDAVHVGAARVHLTGTVSVGTVHALRTATPALISAGTGPVDAALDLVGFDHPSVAGHTVFTDAAGDPVLVDMLPPACDDDAATVAALGTRLAGLAADGPLRSVIADGDRAMPAVLTALAAGAHLRIGSGTGSGSDRPSAVADVVAAVARAAALARLAGRPPLTVDEARARLRR